MVRSQKPSFKLFTSKHFTIKTKRFSGGNRFVFAALPNPNSDSPTLFFHSLRILHKGNFERLIPMKNMILLASFLFTCVTAGSLHGKTRTEFTGSVLTKQTQTAFVETDFGVQTYESQGVESNASTTAMTYSVGGYAGEHRRLGVFATIANSETDFALNQSSVGTYWRDLSLQMRLGAFYPKIIATSSEIKVNDEAGNRTHIFSTGVGAGIDAYYAITQKIIVNAKAQQIDGSSSHDKFGSAVEVGSRKKFEVGAAIDIIPRFLDLMAGYRVRSFNYTIEGQSFTDKQSTPYTGLRLGLYF